MLNEKQIQLKINSVKRILKEQQHYKDEIKNIQTAIEEMKSADADIYDIKKKQEILEETMNTKEHTNKLVKKFMDELQSSITKNLESGDISMELIEQIQSLE